MRLSIILESPQDQAMNIAERVGIKPEVVVHMCKSTNAKYWKWILLQWYNKKISLPKDAYRVHETLHKFQVVASRLPSEQKDINQYKKLDEIEQIVSDVIGIEVSSKTHNLADYIGDRVKVAHKQGPYVTLEITDIEALKELGEGTDWCTRGSYPNCKAGYYLELYGKVMIVFQNGRPVLQYAPDFSEIKDIHDKEVRDPRVLSLVAMPDPPDLSSDARTLVNYATNIIKRRWPEAEPIIMQNPEEAYFYTLEAINRHSPISKMIRWTEAEPYILQNYDIAFRYARDIIKGRWLEAEPIIMQYPAYAYQYAKEIINKSNTKNPVRWTEAEPYILKNANFALQYARDIIKGRWPKAEAVILQHGPYLAYEYARDVVKGRWPEAEPLINQNKDTAYKYDFIEHRRPTIWRDPEE